MVVSSSMEDIPRKEQPMAPPKGVKRPRDPVRLAATIIGLATGQITEAEVDATERAPKRRKGGIKGGKARAKALTAARRTEIAHAGAQARWKGKRVAAASMKTKKE